ncbi:MAG: SIR2 family protein [Alphaproteobacteria bacterium]|nr:SIR2 family protein [Alphaproteobacteria bacterium]
MIGEDEHHAAIAEIAAALAEDETVLFIGSGISASAGIVGWNDLLLAFAGYCDKHKPVSDETLDLIASENPADLLLAADRLEESITSEQRNQFFATQPSFQNAEPQEIHELIVALGPTCFLTTNYDNLLEQTFEASPDLDPPNVYSNVSQGEFGRLKMAGTRDFIYKVHGDISIPESIVLSRRNYAKLTNSNAGAYSAFKALLETRPIVLLGFGLRDPDFSALLDWATETYGSAGVEMYAIMANASAETRRYWLNNYNVTILSYSAPGSDHSQLLLLLDDLKTRVAEIQMAQSEEAAEELGPPTPQPAVNNNAIARLDDIEGEGRKLMEVILSVLHWTSRRYKPDIVTAVKLIMPDAEDALVVNHIERLELKNIVRVIGTAVLPIDNALIEATGSDRVEDAAKFLGGEN